MTTTKTEKVEAVKHGLLRGVAVVKRGGFFSHLAFDEEIVTLVGVWTYFHAHDGGKTGVGGTQTEWVFADVQTGAMTSITLVYAPDHPGPGFDVCPVPKEYNGPEEAEGQWLLDAEQHNWPVIQSPRRLEYGIESAPEVGPDWAAVDVDYDDEEPCSVCGAPSGGPKGGGWALCRYCEPTPAGDEVKARHGYYSKS